MGKRGKIEKAYPPRVACYACERARYYELRRGAGANTRGS
jgi:hypothetical protein